MWARWSFIKLGQKLGCPHPKKIGQNAQFGLKFSVCAPITLGWRGVASQNFHVTCRETGMITSVQLPGGPPAVKFVRAKTVHNSVGAILDNFSLPSRISPEWMKISKIGKSKNDQLRSLPRSTRNFYELWSTNKNVTTAHVDPPKIKFFGRLYFGP